MPLYEYQCDACGRRFEVIQKKFSDPPVETCPTCGGTVQKLASSPAIQFKGTGFYITDYPKKGGGGEGSKADAKTTNGTGKSDGDKTAGKSDSATTPSESKSSAPTASSTDPPSKNS